MYLRFSVLLLAFCSLHTNALAWGCKGHQAVAIIVGRYLTPEAR